MFRKRVITMVGDEIVFSNIITIDENNVDAIEKLEAVFASNPTIHLVDDLDAVEGAIWDGEKFVHPSE